MARTPTFCAGMLLLAAAALMIPAPAAMAGSLGVRRRIARIDFESEKGTGQKIPRGWNKSALPGVAIPPEARFPDYVEGALSVEQAYEGAFSFRMALDGGNCAYTWTDGVRVHPDSDYLLVGHVRTADLTAARAQLRMFLLDARGEPIPGAMSVSEPMGAPGGAADGRWRRFEVRLNGAHPAAVRLAVTLSLVQPELWRPASERAVDRQDITGRCWWDDIVIYRLPRITVTTDAPANVFGPTVRPRLKMHLEGLDFADCGLVLTIRDAEGAARMRRLLDPPGPGESVDRELPLEGLAPGLYTADLSVAAGAAVLMNARLRFAVLAELPPGGRGSLELDASALAPAQWPVLAAMAAELRAGGVKLSAWPAGVDSRGEGPVAERMAVLLSRLDDHGAGVTMVLDRLPADLQPPGEPPVSIVDALAAGDKPVADAVAWLLAGHAPRVRWWQLGADGDTTLPWNPCLAEACRRGRSWTQRLLARTDLQLAWPTMLAFDLPAPAPLSLRLDPAVAPEQAPGQIAEFEGRVAAVHLAAQPENTERLARLADFALRYAFIRAAGARRVAIDPPWRVDEGGAAEPTELLLVARTLAGYLDNAECLGSARLSESSVAVIFRHPAGDGVMLVYRDDAGADPAPVAVNLPSSAYRVDLWGRRGPLDRRDGRVLLQPATTPFLVADCDAETLALRSSLRFEPDVVDSAYESRRGRLSFRNPYTQPVSGSLRVAAPEGWKVSPRVAAFNLGPGQEWSGEVTLRFPYNAVAGLKQLDVTMDVEAAEERTIEAPAFFYLTMKGVTFDPLIAVTPDGALEVQVCVINNRPAPISFTCFAQVPDRPRQSRQVHQLGAGAKAVKIFRFDDGVALIGKTLRTGLRETGGSGVLNCASVVR